MGVIVGLVAVLGAAVGSFLNVVVYRVPLGASVVSPPSACPTCGTRIRWFDNVPVVSWLVLRARCRNCGTSISARYPLVELATAVAFGAIGVAFVPQLIAAPTGADTVAVAVVLVAHLYFAALSIALSLIDLAHHRLPNALVLPAYPVAAVLFGAATALSGDLRAGALAAAGAGILFGVFLVIALIAPKGMGLGDVKLAGVIGMFLGWAGWSALAVGAAAAFLIGGVVGIVLIALRRARRGSGIPFGPCMLAGAWVGITAGDPIARAYLTLAGLD